MVKYMKAKAGISMKTKKGKQFAHVSPKEEELMRELHEKGFGVDALADFFRRSTDTISKHLDTRAKATKVAPKGRPKALPAHLWPKVDKIYNDLLAKAKTKSEVTANKVRLAIKAKLRINCCTKSVSRCFWEHGVYFRPLYEKPELDDSDKKKRCNFGKKHSRKTAKQWVKPAFDPAKGGPHCIIDNKLFQVYTKGKDRDFAARRRCRGAYRQRRRVYNNRTKPPANLKKNTGAKSATVTCAIGGGSVIMWHVTPGQWNKTAAADMYKVLKRRLQAKYPSAKKFRIMEDNDPTGYKSTLAKETKQALGLSVLELPPRSPDLNGLDYSVWAEVNRRMRNQEKKWHLSKRESRDQYLARLRRTAMGLPPAYINGVIGSMAKRCKLLERASGGHFPEGGKVNV